MAQLAAEAPDQPIKADYIAQVQEIPLRFLITILIELKHARLIRSSRGSAGGYTLSRPPKDITLADILRSVEGPLVNLHDARIGELGHTGPAHALTDVWMAVRSNVRLVLESVTLAAVVADELPANVKSLAERYCHEQSPDTISAR